MAGLVSTIVPDFTFTDGPAGRIACSVRRTGGRRSNRGSDWRLVTATSVRAHSADRRPGAGHRARRPGARAQPGAPDAYAPIWLLPRIVRTCHDTATCPRQNCLHAQRRPPPGPRRQPTPLSPKKRRYGRFSTISRAAQPSSRARETFSRPDPGAATPRPSKSAARWCAATASRRSPGPPRPTCSSAMPIELGRRSTSSTNGGRRTPDVPRPGPPRRLPTPTRQTPRRRRDPQTRSPRVRVAVWLRLPQRSLPRRPPVLATAPTAEAPAALLMPRPAGPAPICLPSGLRLWTAVRCAQGHGLRCAPGPRPGPLWNLRPGSSR